MSKASVETTVILIAFPQAKVWDGFGDISKSYVIYQRYHSFNYLGVRDKIFHMALVVKDFLRLNSPFQCRFTFGSHGVYQTYRRNSNCRFSHETANAFGAKSRFQMKSKLKRPPHSHRESMREIAKIS